MESDLLGKKIIVLEGINKNTTAPIFEQSIMYKL